jgi:hypothetical protein
MTDEYEYFANKKPNRTYFSKPFKQVESFDENFEPVEGKALRIVSKVFDTDECQGFAKVRNETLLRVTPGERQEIKAIFYQDSREIKRIIFQRFTIKNGTPMKVSFSFGIDEIEKIYNLLKLIKFIELDENEKTRFDDNVLNAWFVTDVEKKNFLLENSDLITEIVKNDITKSDVVAFGYRKRQLEIFERLLHDSTFFDSLAKEWNVRGKEAVWQKFFESNPWIFGYGLHYIFNTQLDNKKLEQITTGYSVQESGKRVDALMKTSGLISSLCFIEIKTHATALLSKEPYRAECWRISDELAGSVSQVQKTVQKAIKTIQTKIEIESKYGEPTGEVAFLYQPKAYVVIGSLSEFIVGNGINEQKFSSFELFRRNITNPEIITFDELYDRAKFIAQLSENESSSCESAVAQISDFPLEDDIPF